MRGLSALVSSQFGVLTRRQALECGLTDEMVDGRRRSGEWVTVARGVYRVATSARTWHQDLMLACLCGGASSFVSHESAAALWTLPGFSCRRVEISGPRRLRITPGFVAHRVSTPPSGDVVGRSPFRVSSPTRTLIELAGNQPTDRVEVALDDALRRRLTSLPRIRWRLDRVGARGVMGAKRLRALVGARDPEARPESPLERSFLRFLELNGLPRPETQLVVADDDGFVARLDLAYPAHRVAVEVDGYRFHAGRVEWEQDRRRRNRLEGLGWRVLNATAAQMRDRPDAILKPLRRLLETQRRLDV